MISLRAEGFNVSGEGNPKRALELLTSGTEAFDVVVLDYAMPEMNGLEFAQAICAGRRQGVSYPPIVMLSAYADGAVALAALRAGVWDFLNKPFVPEDVRSRVGQMLKRPSQAAQPEGFEARVILRCQACDWEGATRLLREWPAGGPDENKRSLVSGLIAQIMERHEECHGAFERARWWSEWHLQGPEIWTEFARRMG